MIFDFITVVPLLTVLGNTPAWLRAFAIGGGIIALEFYSALPTGVASVPLIVALLSVWFFFRIFDAHELLSFALIFLGCALVYTASMAGVRAWYEDAWSASLSLRAFIFFIRIVCIGISCTLFLLAMQYIFSIRRWV